MSGDRGPAWVFVRHGQSVANAERWFSGHVDTPLTPVGQAQAEALVGVLAEHPLVRVVSSDLQRAHHTASPVARARGLTVQTTPALRERHLGAWSRVPVEEAPEALFEVLHDFRRRPPEGESLADVASRAIAWLDTLPPVEGPTLVVAHGGVLRALLGLIDGLPEAEIPRRQVANTQAFVRVVRPEVWRRLHARCLPD